MKLLRYFIRGVQEVAKDLGILKSVVRPKRVEPPVQGRIQDVLRYLKQKHALEGIGLFDSKGVLVGYAGNKGLIQKIFSIIEPLSEELESTHVFVRRRDFWATLFSKRGFKILLLTSYHPDIVDLWVIGREFERYMWGYAWEG